MVTLLEEHAPIWAKITPKCPKPKEFFCLVTIRLISESVQNMRIFWISRDKKDYVIGKKGPHIIFCVIVRVIPDFGVSTAIILSSKHFPYVVQVGLWTLEKEVVNCKIEHENSKFAV